MSEASKAVFLSYASQDTAAAKRICDTLRAAGVEVWFDQSELVGGDAWDQKIRKQIKDCALLIPLISASTQARHEGYFRLEWRLADQRTHLMGRSKAFLLPVTIDGTTDAQADVPDSFVAVQWTKAPGGELPPGFAARVRKLLDGGPSSGEAEPQISKPAARELGAPPSSMPKWTRPILASAALVIAVLGVTLYQRRDHVEPGTKAAAAAPDAELAALRARIVPEQWQKEDFEAIDPTLDRFIQKHPESADGWALRSLINSLQVARNYDPGTRPLETGKADAERALRLDAQAPLAQLAMGMHLVAMISRGGDAEACRPWIDRAVAALPHDPLTRYSQGVSHWLSYDFAATEPEMREWLESEPQAGFPKWILAQLALVRRQPDECERYAREAAHDEGITGIRARYTLFESSYYLRADLARSREALDQIPASGKAVHRVVHARWLMAMDERRWDDALQALVRLPENFMFDRAYHGPKALLAGLAHARAGRPEAAHTQFAEAERLLREHLAEDHDNEELHAVLAVTLACLGRADEARGELALVEPLVNGRPPNVYRGSLVVPLAQARCILGDYGLMVPWVRKLFAEYSAFSFTPASFSLDARFSSSLAAPEVQALLKEFAALDKPVASEAAKVDEKSVAVLAFANLSDDKANEYFSDGISEELLNVLAKIPDLKVSARTSAFSFKGKEVAIPEIARQLGVAYVVEGSVRRQGDKVRITAQLIKAADGFHVWSDTFTRDLKDIFAVQDEIAGLIARNLSLKLGVASVAASRAVDPEAYRLMLLGRDLVYRGAAGDLEQGQKYLQDAVERDEKFALAWAWLGITRWALAANGWSPIESGFKSSREAAEKALALEPDLPEANTAVGFIYYGYDWDWARARAVFQRALALAPGDAAVVSNLTRLAITLGENDEAVRLGRQAVALDPLNSYAQYVLSMALLQAGRYAELERQAMEFKSVTHAPAKQQVFALVLQGKNEAALQVAGEFKTDNNRTFLLGLTHWACGHRAEADANLAKLQTEYASTAAYQIAELHAYRGETDEAFVWLETSYRQRDTGMIYLKNDPWLKTLHADPRWPALLKKMNLLEASPR